MARRYENVKAPRFTVESTEGVERIRIPARRNWFILPFLSLWLIGWTAGGVAAVVMIFSQFEPFLLVWLAVWTVAWMSAAATLLWQISGAEYLRVVGGDLEVGYAMPGFKRARLYRGRDIRHLAASGAAGAFGFAAMNNGYPPFLNWMKVGSVKFHYGARTVRAASGLDEAEGRMIVEHLARRLPPSATEH